MRYLILALLALSSCRKDPPPKIDPYVMNGSGVGIYKNPDTHETIKLLPSQMKGYVSFEPKQLEAYVNWCYNPNE
jgi:hypothetical protein